MITTAIGTRVRRSGRLIYCVFGMVPALALLFNREGAIELPILLEFLVSGELREVRPASSGPQWFHDGPDYQHGGTNC
jgi:hypothetical protein